MNRGTLAPWQVWLVDFGVPVGNERGYRRPAIVVASAGRIALRGDTTVVVPLTARDRGWPHHVPIGSPDSGVSRPSWARTEDIRSVSTRRFTSPHPLGTLNADERRDVQRWVRRMLDI